MNTAQLWSEPKKKRGIAPQVFVAAALLVALLLGTADWQSAASRLAMGCQAGESAQSCIRPGS